MSTAGGIIAGVRQVLNRLEAGFLCLLLLGMIGLSCLQIILRDFFSSGLPWADPLLRQMVLWAGMFGAVAATRQGKHIAIDIASHLLPAAVQPWLKLLLNSFAALVSAVLAYAALQFLRNEAAFAGKTGLLGLPSWQWNLVFPVAFSLICLSFLGQVGTSLRAIASTGETPPPAGPEAV